MTMLTVRRCRVGSTLTEDALPSPRFPTYVRLIYVQVSPAVVAHLISRLPRLLSLDYDRMATVIAAMTAGPCGLTRLSLSSCGGQEGEAVAEVLPWLCPKLAAFSMDNSQLCPWLMHVLPGLVHLTQLELGWASLTEANSCLHPLLKAIGGRLTHLSLENVEDCDILRLGRQCPRLVSLKLSAFLTSSQPATSYEKAPTASATFPHLEEVHIFNSREAYIPYSVVRALMGQLRRAYFQNMTVSWSDLLGKPTVSSHLAAASFENCSELTLSCLLQLLSTDSPLGGRIDPTIGPLKSSVVDPNRMYLDPDQGPDFWSNLDPPWIRILKLCFF